MSTKQILLGFLPWIAFSVVATRVGPGAVGTAALLAFAVAAGLLVHSMVRGRSPKLLEVAGAVTFALAGIWATVSPASDVVLASYGRGGAALILAALIFLTLPVRPFTEQYARESVPEQYWHSPQFHAINRRISAAWGAAVAVMGVGHLIAGALTAQAVEYSGYLPSRPVDLLLNWIVPGLLVLAAARYTTRVTTEAGRSPVGVR
jgi:hypothetical protein